MEDEEPEELGQAGDWRAGLQRYSFAAKKKQIVFTNKLGTTVIRNVYYSSDTKLDVALRGLVKKLTKFNTINSRFGDVTAMYELADRYRNIINLQSSNLTLVAAAIVIIEWTPTDRMGQLNYGIQNKMTLTEWPRYVDAVKPHLISFYKTEPKEIALEADLKRTIDLILISPSL